MPDQYIAADSLREFGTVIFERLGLPGPDAAVVADCLVQASLRGLYEDFSGPQRIGHVFVAMRPDLFMPMAEFKQRMDTMIERLKASEAAEGFDEVLMPGEPEARRLASCMLGTGRQDE